MPMIFERPQLSFNFGKWEKNIFIRPERNCSQYGLWWLHSGDDENVVGQRRRWSAELLLGACGTSQFCEKRRTATKT